MIVVADASPLIAMARVEKLDLLRTLFGRLLIPDAVWKEVVEAGADKAGTVDVAGAKWIERRSIMDSSLVNLLKHDLGAGEAEAIVLARELNADFVLMDERLGRSAARSLGLKVVGLVGVLIEATPPVPHVTVVAENPVDGLRALARQQEFSYQVFLWRADSYLSEEFAKMTFEQITTTLKKSGASKFNEYDILENDAHRVLYSIKLDVIKSTVAREASCIVELTHFRKSNVTSVSVSILLKFGKDFNTVASQRDFPKGTVLDRIFGLQDLTKRAKETSQLDSIEVS